jgi:hypothetical protein
MATLFPLVAVSDVAVRDFVAVGDVVVKLTLDVAV